jgi:hypothetical protein
VWLAPDNNIDIGKTLWLALEKNIKIQVFKIQNKSSKLFTVEVFVLVI